MEPDGDFSTSRNKEGEIEIQLNNKYFIKEDH